MVTLESIPTTRLVTSKKQNINAGIRASHGTGRQCVLMTGEILYLLLRDSQSFIKHE